MVFIKGLLLADLEALSRVRLQVICVNLFRHDGVAEAVCNGDGVNGMRANLIVQDGGGVKLLQSWSRSLDSLLFEDGGRN